MKLFGWIVILLTALPCAADDQVCETLKISGGTHWFPFFFRELPTEDSLLPSDQRDRLQGRNGILGDIVLLAAKRANIPVIITEPKPWRRILFDLSQGQTDVLAGALKTEERAELFSFSDAVYYSEFRLFVRRDKQFTFHQLSDLKHRNGVKLGGMSFGQTVDSYIFDNLIMEEVSETASLFRMLEAKRADYAIFHLNSGLEIIHQLAMDQTLVALPNAVAKEPIFVAFSRRSRCSAQISILQEEIRHMLGDGSVAGIIDFYNSLIQLPPGAQLGKDANSYYASLFGIRVQ